VLDGLEIPPLAGLTACDSTARITSEIGQRLFAQVEPSMLIAVDGYRFGGRECHRIQTVRELRAGPPPPARRSLSDLAARRTPDALSGVAFHVLAPQSCDPEFEQVPFRPPAWGAVLVGHDGVPKNTVHGHSDAVLARPAL